MSEDSRDEGTQRSPATAMSLQEIGRVLVRRKTLAAGTALACIALAAIVSVVRTPVYKATVTLEIERKGPEVVEFTDVVGTDPAGYKDFYQTQFKIIQSRQVAERTVSDLDLANEPAILKRGATPLGRAVRAVRSLWSDPSPKDPDEAAIRFVQERLHVNPIRNSHLVKVSILDSDGALAARIANGVAAAYQEFQADKRFDLTDKAKAFLEADVERVRNELEQAEAELQGMAVERDYVPFGDGSTSIGEQALASLNSRHAEAQARLAAAEGRLEAVRAAPDDALPEVLQNDLVQRLRDKRAALERDAARLNERFGPDWPALRQVREELDRASRQLDEEEARIAERVRGSAETRYEELRAEVAALARERDTQKQRVQRLNADSIAYSSLRREVEAKRETLGALTSRKSETETSAQLRTSGTSNIRVVDAARVPNKPVAPNIPINLIVGAMLGVAAGVGLALTVHTLDNTVKSEEDLRRFADLPALAHIPATRTLRAVPAGDGKDPADSFDLGSHYAPKSEFAESFRSLRTSLLLAVPDHPPRHVVVTSSAPAEGKSTVSMNLAIVLTQLGRRVLLIDADLRRARLHTSFGLPAGAGLSSYLSGNADFDELPRATDIPGLSLITSGPIPPNPSELLGSPRLGELLRHAVEEGQFDHVIVDSAPLLSVADSLVLASRADATLLVVRARSTTGEAVARARAHLRRAHANVVGAVLNALEDSDRFAYYGRYYGPYGSQEASPGDAVGGAGRRGRRKTRERTRRAGATPEPADPSPHAPARTALRRALLLLLVLAPLPFGAVPTPARVALQVAAAALGAGALWIVLRDPRSLPPRGVLSAWGAVLLVGLIQSIPLPDGLRAALGEAFAAQSAVGGTLPDLERSWAPATLDPAATADALLLWIAFAGIGLAAAVSTPRVAHRLTALRAVALIGTAQAAYGIAELLTGSRRILGVPKRYFVDEATGTFVNRNHFAGFLALCLPAAIVLALEGRERRRAPRTSWRSRLAGALEGRGASRWLFAGGATVVATGILLSSSRGGAMALALGGAGALLLAGGPRPRTWIAALLLLTVPWAFLLARPLQVPGERFLEAAGDDASIEQRVTVWGATARIALDHPLLGTGLGTFEPAFELKRPPTISKRWAYAHSDWLQAWAEGGPWTPLALLALLALLLRRTLAPAIRAARGAPGLGADGAVRAALGLALLVAALQGTFDFCARIPAIGTLLAALVGLAAAGAPAAASPRFRSRPPR